LEQEKGKGEAKRDNLQPAQSIALGVRHLATTTKRERASSGTGGRK